MPPRNDAQADAPLSDRLAALVEMVEAGEFLEAMLLFYAADVEVRENEQAPRLGLEAAIANEERVLAAFPRVAAKALATFAAGDEAVIRWTFEFATADGTTFRLDELALQTWRDGWIVREKFYYDPAQMQAAVVAANG